MKPGCFFMKSASSCQVLRKVSSSALSSVNTFTSTTGPVSIAIWRSIGKSGSRGRSSGMMVSIRIGCIMSIWYDKAYQVDIMMSSKKYGDNMNKTRRPPAAEALSNIMLDLFRLNSLLLTAGDRLVAPLGLTSARWQILGAIATAERLEPVAWLARNLGANRQNVQRIVNDLHGEGLVAFETNPHHRRAQLVVLTDKGKQTFDAAMRMQGPWVNSLSDGLSVKHIQAVHRLIIALRRKLESNAEERQL